MKHHITKKILEKLQQNPDYYNIQEVIQETKPSRIQRTKEKKSQHKRKQD